MFKVLTKGCEPTMGSKYSACVDLYASEDCTIGAGETNLVGVGVCIDEEKIECIIEWRPKKVWKEELNSDDYNRSIEELEHFKKSHYLQLMLRSSLGKKGLMLANGVGVIDLDYPDEIKMLIHNPISHVFGEENGDGSLQTFCKTDDIFTIAKSFQIKKGDKIGQITLLEHKAYLFGIETEDERSGGFGSTDEQT